MSETNPNYVPVNWLNTSDEMAYTETQLNAADESACPTSCPYVEPHHHVHDEIVFTTPVGAGTVAHILAGVSSPEDSNPARETSTLNSAGDPIKIGDRVRHLADAGQDDRDTGTVTYVGPVEICGVTVDNGCRCKWIGSDDETPHHVDLLAVIV